MAASAASTHLCKSPRANSGSNGASQDECKTKADLLSAITLSDHPSSVSGQADDEQCLAACRLQKSQAASQLADAFRHRASRHKLTCRKKTTVSTFTEILLQPDLNRASPKHAKTAASPNQEAAQAADTADSFDVTTSLTDRLNPHLGEPRQKGKRRVAAQAQKQANAQPARVPRKRQKTTTEAVAVQAAVVQSAAKRKSKTADTSAPADLPPMPEEHKEYAHVPGHEPYQMLGMTVREIEILDADSLVNVAKAKALYNKKYREARVIEDARYAATQGNNPETGKSLSRRPDTLARKHMDEAHACINTKPVAGHVPGIAIGDRFYLRAEMGVLGMHYPPLGGIDYMARPSEPGCPKYATSIVAAGGYEDDRDDGHELVYTGQGGNDLLGNRKQQGEQKLVLGNLALVGNIQLGIPVRVTRRNEEKDALSGYVFIYDGLYDVVKYWLEKGIGGHSVYKYLLRRRPNQGELATCRVEFGGKSAPKGMSALTRHGVFDTDLSCGREHKPVSLCPVPASICPEPADVVMMNPVVAVNEVNEAIVPFTAPGKILREQDMKGNPLTHLITDRAKQAHQKTLDYISKCTFAATVPVPPTAGLPAKFKGRPHAYVEYLNGGLLPYHDRAGSKGNVRQARRVQPVLYECGPHFNCPDGPNCSQAATAMGCPYRLEVFQTDSKGWGLCSWDMIPTGAFVVEYTGSARPCHIPEPAHRDDHKQEDSCTDAKHNQGHNDGVKVEDGSDDEQHDERHDDEYNFDLAPRPYSECEKVKLPLLPPEEEWEVKYVLDAKHEGNAGRFINHSCDPNLYVQPVLTSHHNHALPKVCLFASQNIAPLTELTFDYGLEYIQHNLQGHCHCGSAACVGLAIKARGTGDANQPYDRKTMQ